MLQLRGCAALARHRPDVSHRVVMSRRCYAALAKEVSKSRDEAPKASNLKLLERVGDILGIKSKEDWYKYTSEDFERSGGAYALHTSRSLYLLLKETYPEHAWDPNRFPHRVQTAFPAAVPLRELIEMFAAQRQIKTLSDWYKVDVREVPTSLEKRYLKMSLQEALSIVYPDHKWQPWLFGRTPKGWWDSLPNQKRFLQEQVIPALSIQSPTDWYHISSKQLVDAGAEVLIKLYRAREPDLPAIYSLVSTVFVGDHEWLPWLFDQSEKRTAYWKRKEWQRKYVQWFECQQGFVSRQDWYSVTASQMKEWGGNNLLKLYNGSIVNFVQNIYPDHQWNPQRFEPATRTTLGTKAQQEKVLKKIASKLNVSSLIEWYHVTTNDFNAAGGAQAPRNLIL